MLFSEKSIRVILAAQALYMLYVVLKFLFGPPPRHDPQGLTEAYSILLTFGANFLIALLVVISHVYFYKLWGDWTRLYFWLIVASPLWATLISVIIVVLRAFR